MSPEIDITTGRIDDFPLLLEGMIQLGFPGLIDHPLNRLVQARVRQAGKTIERITGQIEQRTLNYGLVDH